MRPFGTKEEDRDEDRSMSRTIVADWGVTQKILKAFYVFGVVVAVGTWTGAYVLFGIQSSVSDQKTEIDGIRVDMARARDRRDQEMSIIRAEMHSADSALDAKFVATDERVDSLFEEQATTKEAIAGMRAQMSTGFSNVDGDLGVIQRQMDGFLGGNHK